MSMLSFGSGSRRRKRESASVPAFAPAILSNPVLLVVPTVGVAMSFEPAVATGYPTPVLTTKWYLDDVEIVGETGPTYTPVLADVGGVLTVKQTATNSQGSATSGASNGETVISYSAGDDIGGWTNLTPVTRDTGTYVLKDKSQPGTRIYYIDPVDGVDSNTGSADFYFWDGANIIDSSGSTTGAGAVAYGTDPLNPTGPIKPYKTWCWAWPRADGSSDTVNGNSTTNWLPRGTGGPIRRNSTMTAGGRNGKPDWFLFKRGTSIDITADVSACSITDQTNNITMVLPGSANDAGINLVGAYGSLALARPRFHNPISAAGFVSVSTTSALIWKNTAYVSLHFDRDVLPAASTAIGYILAAGHDSTSVNNLVEDCWFDRLFRAWQITGSTYTGSVTFRRCVLTEGWGDGAPSGVFSSPAYPAIVKINDCIAIRNGYATDPETSWPCATNILTRNYYCSGHVDPVLSEFSGNVSLEGASGDQFRHGAQIEKNFFLQEYLQMGTNGGYEGAFDTGNILNNVIELDTRPAGNPGGFSLYGTRGGAATDNIITSGGRTTDVSSAITLGSEHFFGAYKYRMLHGVDGTTISGTLIDVRGSCTRTVNYFGRKTYQGDNWKGTYNGSTFEPTGINANYLGLCENEAEMLAGTFWTGGMFSARTPGVGLYCTRYDTGKLYIINAMPISSAGNWTEVTPSVATYGNYMLGPVSAYTNPFIQDVSISNTILVSSSAFSAANSTSTIDNSMASPTTHTNNTDITGTTAYTTIEDAVTGEGWSDAGRSLKSYLQSLGETVTSDTGVTEYLALAKTMWKGQWPNTLTAQAIVNYVRAGYDWSAI